MRKILNYTIPPIKCFMHQAIPLGVFWDENDQNVMNWFCLNYNYILAGTRPQDYFFTFLVNFSSIPFLQKREIYGDELENYLSKHSFPALVKGMIDNGNFVEVIADMFYMNRADFGHRHMMHEMLILGYDDEKDTFIMAVRNVGLRFVSAGHGQNLLEKRQTDVHWRTEKGRGTRTLDLLSQ